MRFNDKHIKLDNNEPDEEFRLILAFIEWKLTIYYNRISNRTYLETENIS